MEKQMDRTNEILSQTIGNLIIQIASLQSKTMSMEAELVSLRAEVEARRNSESSAASAE